MTINKQREKEPTISTTTSNQPQQRPALCRRRGGRVATGVAGGLAAHLAIRPIYIRLAFVILATPLLQGVGALIYVALWAVLPSDDSGTRAYRDINQWPMFAFLGIGLIGITTVSGWTGPAMIYMWLAAVAAAGAGLIWHQITPNHDWVRILTGAKQNPRATLLRLGGGFTLVAIGIIGSLVVIVGLNAENLSTLGNSLLFTGIALAGIALVVGPLGWRTITDLRTEREARVREQERADVAAMIHDQVLHTLALIQRRSDNPREVARLARGQERSLRNWLYKTTAEPNKRFHAAIEAASAEIEDAFALTVDTVVVGDCDVDTNAATIAAAAREAMVNAAKHADVTIISVYAEVEDTMLSVFVRDRGTGFDTTHIAPDRHGVSGSIIDRMLRHGGRAEVKSTVGEGTEVRLWMPREPKE